MKTHYPEALTFISHSLTASIVAISHYFTHNLPVWVQILLLAIYIGLVVTIFKKLRRQAALHEEEPLRQEINNLNQKIAELNKELAKSQRYNSLRKHMLSVVGEFIKERYKVNFDLTKKLSELNISGNVAVKEVKALLTGIDMIRREKVKSALMNLSSALEADYFKKPSDVDGDNKDEMKVSFYAVEPDPNNAHHMILRPRARYYPNEGEPKTPKFTSGEGAAGTVWSEKKTVICENGGEDPLFKEMRPGQKEEYASMICIPAIMDIPAYTINDVYGILTLDSAVRRGYFQKEAEKFWADLFQPLGNILIYARESSNLIDAINGAIDAVASTNTSPSLQ